MSGLGDAHSAQQERVFMNLVNTYLKSSHREITKLTDLSTGVDLFFLIKQLEEVEGKEFKDFKKMETRRINMKIVQKTNIQAILTYLKENTTLLLHGIATMQVVDKDHKIISALLWNIILYYHIKRSDRLVGGDDKEVQKKEENVYTKIMTWMNDIFESDNMNAIEEITSVKIWKEKGTSFFLNLVKHLLKKYVINNEHSKDDDKKEAKEFLQDVGELEKEGGREKEILEKLLNFCEKKMNIPKLIEPEDIIVNPEKLCLTTYLASFRNYITKMEDEHSEKNEKVVFKKKIIDLEKKLELEKKEKDLKSKELLQSVEELKNIVEEEKTKMKEQVIQLEKVRGDLEVTHREKEEVEKSFQEMKEKNMQVERTLEETTNFKRELEAELNTTREEKSRIEKHLDESKNECAAVQETLRKTKEDKSQVETDLEKMTGYKETLEKDLGITQQEKEAVENTLKTTVDDKKKVEEQLKKTETEWKMTEEKLKETNENFTREKEEKENVQSELKSTREEKEVVEKKLEVETTTKETVMKNLETTQTELKTTIEEKEDLEKKLEVETTTKETLKKNLENTQTELKSTKEEKEEVEKKLVVETNEKESVMKKLENTKVSWNKDIEEFEVEKEIRDSKIENLRNVVGELNEEIKDLKEYKSILLETEKGLNCTIVEKDEEIKKLKDHKDFNEKKIYNLQREEVDLKGVIEEQKHIITNLKFYIASTKLKGDGWLLKEGHLRKNWKYRYFKCSNIANTFSYYKQPEDVKPIKTVKIPGPYTVEKISGKKKAFTFKLSTTDGKWSFTFAASNDTERNRWVNYWKKVDVIKMAENVLNHGKSILSNYGPNKPLPKRKVPKNNPVSSKAQEKKKNAKITEPVVEKKPEPKPGAKKEIKPENINSANIVNTSEKVEEKKEVIPPVEPVVEPAVVVVEQELEPPTFELPTNDELPIAELEEDIQKEIGSL